MSFVVEVFKGDKYHSVKILSKRYKLSACLTFMIYSYKQDGECQKII